MTRAAAAFLFTVIAMVATQANAEAVWTCHQPSVTDGKILELRYYVHGSELMEPDPFGLKWTIVKDNSVVFIASSQVVDSLPDARTLVIDVRTGDMTLAVINMHSSDAPSRIINGTCVKD